MSESNFAFTNAEKTQNNRSLATLIPIVSGLRPSMVRRLQRATAKTECYFIAQKEPSKAQIVSAMTIPKAKQPVVSWLVPNTQDTSKPYEFCFSVNEVQQFIANHVKDESCPMFGHDQIQNIVGDGIAIDKVMPREFRFVFQEFYLLPYSQDMLKEDTITKAAIDVVEQHVQKKVEDPKSSANPNTYAGHFWKFTKKYLGTVGDIAANVLRFVLGNPWWTSIIKMLAKALRVAICAASSFLGGSINGAKHVIDMVKKQFIAQMGTLAHGPMLVLDLAKSLLFKLLSASELPVEFKDVSDEVKSYRVFGTLKDIIQQSIGFIMDVCGFTFIIRLPKLVLEDSTAIFERVLNPSTMQTFDLKAYTTLDFDFLGMTLLFDVLSTLYLDAEPFFNFALRFFTGADQQQLKTILSEKIKSRKFTWVGILVFALQNAGLRPIFQNAMQELYFWIMDVFPCLFQYFVRNVRAYLLMGVVAPQETNASCCLRDVVMSMQKEAVLYRNERGDAENAQAASNLAMQGSAAKKKEQSWLDYVLRRPFAIDESQQQVDDAFNKDPTLKQDWTELTMEIGTTTAADKPVMPEQKLAAETPDLDTEENELWAAQCGTDHESHVFPNPISVYKHKLPFYFERANNDQNRWCVAPNAADVQKQYPNAMWNFNGQNYVLLHRVPNDLLRHMATMRTPVFSFRAT